MQPTCHQGGWSQPVTELPLLFWEAGDASTVTVVRKQPSVLLNAGWLRVTAIPQA